MTREQEASRKNRRRLIVWPILLVVFLAGIYWLASSWFGGGNSTPTVSTALAKTMTIRDVIVNQGRIESQKTVNNVCEIEGYENKIIFILPEGTLVKKGDEVVKFDTGNALKDIESQEQEVIESKQEKDDAQENVTVQKNENESSIREAKQALDFAKIDLRKYLEGDFEVSKSDMEFAISEAQTEVDKAKRSMENMRALVKRGFRQFEQLREAEQVVTSSEIRLKTSKQKLDILIKFDHPKQETELRSKAKEAEFKLEAAKATAKAKMTKANDYLKYRTRREEREQKQLDGYKKNLEKFVMKAPQDGTVMYPNNEDYYGPGNGIREGGTVYQNQTVYILPNLRKMQVKVGIHESEVSKIKLEQSATIRIDAFPGQPLKGTVKKIGNVAESSWMGTTSEYTVIIHINKMPDDMALKPGMKAQVEISAGRYPNVLGVPMQAVASFGGKRYVYVSQGNDEFERREVQVGKSNVSFVEISEGLKDGERVAMDAFSRSIEDFGDVEPEELIDAEMDEDENEVDANEATAENETKGESSEAESDSSEIGKTSGEAKSSGEEKEGKEAEGKEDQKADGKKAGAEKAGAEKAGKVASDDPKPSEASDKPSAKAEDSDRVKEDSKETAEESNADSDAEPNEKAEAETESAEKATKPALEGNIGTEPESRPETSKTDSETEAAQNESTSEQPKSDKNSEAK